MDKKIKSWILLSIKESFEGRGLRIEEIFQKRPNFMEDNNYSQLEPYLRELGEDNLIKQQNTAKYKLTKEGEKEINKILVNSGPLTMSYLSRVVPEYGFKYKLRVMESFLGSLFIIIGFMALIGFTENYLVEHTVLSFFIATLLIIFGLMFLSAGITITLDFLIMISGRIYKPLIRLASKSIVQTILFILFFVGVIIGVIIVFTTLTGYPWENIIGPLVVALVVLSITKVKKIFEWVKNKINKKSD